jgi:hypothetical protein
MMPAVGVRDVRVSFGSGATAAAFISDGDHGHLFHVVPCGSANTQRRLSLSPRAGAWVWISDAAETKIPKTNFSETLLCPSLHVARHGRGRPVLAVFTHE